LKVVGFAVSPGYSAVRYVSNTVVALMTAMRLAAVISILQARLPRAAHHAAWLREAATPMGGRDSIIQGGVVTPNGSVTGAPAEPVCLSRQYNNPAPATASRTTVDQ
jgi:hypothetical protein